jgi:hypothetical protein
MEYTITLNEQQIEVLKTIFAQIAPMPLIVTPVSKTKKLSKTEQMTLDRREYRANKVALKAERRKNNS